MTQRIQKVGKLCLPFSKKKFRCLVHNFWKQILDVDETARMEIISLPIDFDWFWLSLCWLRTQFYHSFGFLSLAQKSSYCLSCFIHRLSERSRSRSVASFHICVDKQKHLQQWQGHTQPSSSSLERFTYIYIIYKFNFLLSFRSSSNLLKSSSFLHKQTLHIAG